METLRISIGYSGDWSSSKEVFITLFSTTSGIFGRYSQDRLSKALSSIQGIKVLDCTEMEGDEWSQFEVVQRNLMDSGRAGLEVCRARMESGYSPVKRAKIASSFSKSCIDQTERMHDASRSLYPYFTHPKIL